MHAGVPTSFVPDVGPTALAALPEVLTLGALGAGAAGLAWSVFFPGSRAFAPVIRVIPSHDAVALTFDDGPTPAFTARILDILSRRGLQASFFVIGRSAQEHPGLLRRMREEGHTIGNHSFDHHHFGVVGRQDYWHDQLARTNEAVRPATGVTPTLFRPPMGFKTWHMAAAARELSLRLVGWSARARDTQEISPERIVARLTPALHAGAILALHDGLEPARRQRSQEATVEALPSLLERVAAAGLRCVSLDAALSPPCSRASNTPAMEAAAS